MHVWQMNWSNPISDRNKTKTQAGSSHLKHTMKTTTMTTVRTD